MRASMDPSIWAGLRIGRRLVEPLDALCLVAGHPGVDRLVADTELAGDLGHREPVTDDAEDRVVTLLRLVCSQSTAHPLVEVQERISSRSVSSKSWHDVKRLFGFQRGDARSAIRGEGRRCLRLEV